MRVSDTHLGRVTSLSLERRKGRGKGTLSCFLKSRFTVDFLFSSWKRKSTVPAMLLLTVAVKVDANISGFSVRMQTVKCVLLVVFKSGFVFQIKDRNLFFLPGAQEVLIDPGT